MESIAAPMGTRRLARDAVRAHVAVVAVDLFAARGFDAVTVEQIATAAGISPRSFHRYFAAKEDTVVGDVTQWTPFVEEAFAARPADEPVWDALLAAFESLVDAGDQPERMRRGIVSVAATTASLRARSLEKHLDWARVLVPLVARRLRGADADLRAQAIVQSALACFDVGLAAWAGSDAAGASAVPSLRRAFRAVAPA